MSPRVWLRLGVALAVTTGVGLAWPQPASAASGDASPAPQTPDKDEKLPAQLPSVTIQGEDLSGIGDRGQNKLAPNLQTGATRIRLPEPAQRRATSEDNRSLMVNVTPSTIEGAPALPGVQLPYTSLTAGYGPLTQYRLGLYDARTWGPALGITEIDGRAGWGWSGWQGKEWLDWSGVGHLGLQGQGFGWDMSGFRGNQTYFSGSVTHGEGNPLSASLTLNRGQATTAQPTGVGLADLVTSLGSGHVRWRPAPAGDHQWQATGTAQVRTWGKQTGPEAYTALTDFWSLSEQVQLQGGLGGGYWGREPIVDPLMAFHYRPQSSTHMYASLKTASELPDFAALYLNRGSTVAAADLQSERVEGWAQVGGSHRFNDLLWASLDLGLRRSFRHIFWADPEGDRLWSPVNAPNEQWSPGADLRAQCQWLPNLSQEFGYTWTGVYPLSLSENQLETRLTGSFMDQRLTLGAGLLGRFVTLSTSQTPAGGTASGVFAETDVRYALTKDWAIGLGATNVPVLLTPPGDSYFAPTPWLTLNAQYQF